MQPPSAPSQDNPFVRGAGRLPDQRWRIAQPQPDLAQNIAAHTPLSPLLAQVLVNRGIQSVTDAEQFLNPESVQLPSPLEDFPDLATALELLMDAIAKQHRIAICGDYDADGMTSTALLLRSLNYLGAQVDYAIPSRMSEGYGINRRIVEDFHREGVRLILTVDNGIAAHDPIAYARELGITVIVTDHHDIPPTLPPAHAILNPKLIALDSPYSGVAGVGVAYILAVCLAQCLEKTKDLTAPLLELFTLGTIADLAPLRGVNRRWVRRGLKLLPRSRIPGVQALIHVAGLASEEKALKPDAIGFRLGPRINAIGRIADPQIVIELLTTDDPGRALELAMVCEQINQQRQVLCSQIEQEAIAWCEATQPNLNNDRVLVVVQPNWHHGVIGIVASRLVERYGVPVFIGTYEDEEQQHIRGSARGIPEFDVYKALMFAETILDKFGGHRAAGGFSLSADKLDEFRFRLSLAANQQLMLHHLKPLVNVDVEAQFTDLTLSLCDQLDYLHPCGIENPDPVFWSKNVRIVEQKAIGKAQEHLKLVLTQDSSDSSVGITFRAIAWRWGSYCPMPAPVDLAYRLRVNEWNKSRTVELEIVGVRPSETYLSQAIAPSLSSGQAGLPTTQLSLASDSLTPDAHTLFPEHGSPSEVLPTPDPLPQNISSQAIADVSHRSSLAPTFDHLPPQRVEFIYANRTYACSISITADIKELRIQNAQGQVLALQPEQRRGLLGRSRDEAIEIDIAQPFYFNLIRAALQALQSPQSPLSSLSRPEAHQTSGVLDEYAEAMVEDMSTDDSALSVNGEIASFDQEDDFSADPSELAEVAEFFEQDQVDQDQYAEPVIATSDCSDVDEDMISLTSTVIEDIPDADIIHTFQVSDPFPSPSEKGVTSPTLDPMLSDLTETPAEISYIPHDVEDAIAAELEAYGSDDDAEWFGETELEDKLSEGDPLEQDSSALSLPTPNVAQPIPEPTVTHLPAVADLYLSSQDNDTEETPTDLSQIKGLMTAAQLQVKQNQKRSSLRSESVPADTSSSSNPLDRDEDTDEILNNNLDETVLQVGLTDANTPAASVLIELQQATAKYSAVQIRKWLTNQIGESCWQTLQSRSQTDFGAAYRSYQGIWIESDRPFQADYSDAGDRFLEALHREIAQPFFKALRLFLTDQGYSEYIYGIRLTSRTKYQINMVVPLLSETWYVLSASDLANDQAMNPCPTEPMTTDAKEGDRVLVQSFLSEWDCPLSSRLQSADGILQLAQLVQLGDRAAHRALSFYGWQFERLHQLTFGARDEHRQSKDYGLLGSGV